MQKQTDNPALVRRSLEDFRALAAACDMAVLRALELVGNRVVRAERSRFGSMHRSGRPTAEAHTVWRPEPAQIDAALSGAWSVLPRLTSDHGCCSLKEPALAQILDAYVRELVSAQQPHSFESLERRLRDAVEG